jgi:N-acylglucosamine-6-phosphate 2-epimerase
MNAMIKSLRHGCIVSCQALEDEPLFGASHMAAMAVAAEQGGAVAIRCNSPADIAAIRQAVSLPLIGLYKRDYDNSDVYITPTMEEVKAVVEAGAHMVAIDATSQPRPDGRTIAEFIAEIKAVYPQVPIVADISTFEEGVHSMELGADLISTTLSGYTPYSEQQSEPDLELVKRLADLNRTPVLAEGRIWTPDQCLECLRAGAYATVVGTAITRPREITKQFVHVIRGFGEHSQPARKK